MTEATAMFMVERAHRILFRLPKPEAPPRPFLIRLLNYRDRDQILSTAGIRADIQYDNTKLLFFPDYPWEIQQQRREYTEIRRRLREKGLKYSLLYPSKLRVTDGIHTLFFETPTQAVEWLDTK